jgi:hypothetical protein
MTSEEVLLEKIKVLPPNLKQKAIEFVDSLEKEAKSEPRRSLYGILSDLEINITEEDIREARNEMWRGYTEDTENEK